MKPRIPAFESDEAAQAFVDTANLAHYDLTGGTPVQFEFETKTAQLNMRLPQPLLDAVKARAKMQGIPYARFIRRLLEQAVSRPQ